MDGRDILDCVVLLFATGLIIALLLAMLTPPSEGEW